MAAYLADRRGWDPATWDADQERAARAAVVETPAGRLVPATRPHALEARVRTMFGYDPATSSRAVDGADRRACRRRDAAATSRALTAAPDARAAAGRPSSSVAARRATTCCATVRTRSRRRSSAARLRRRRRRPSRRRPACRSSTRPAHLAHDIVTETVMGVRDPGQRGRRAGRADPDARSRPTAASRSRRRPSTATAPILAVHDPGLVRFLEEAWSEARRAGRSTAPFLIADTYPNRSGCSRG